MIQLKEINEENIAKAKKLKISPSQKSYCESVSQSLIDMTKYPGIWKSIGIYNDNELVGYAMYGHVDIPSELEKSWIDRFFIDENFQGKGYGKKAFSELLKLVDKEFNEDQICLSVVSEDIPAVKMYKDFGFDFNGRFDLGGEKIMTMPAQNIKCL